MPSGLPRGMHAGNRSESGKGRRQSSRARRPCSSLPGLVPDMPAQTVFEAWLRHGRGRAVGPTFRRSDDPKIRRSRHLPSRPKRSTNNACRHPCRPPAPVAPATRRHGVQAGRSAHGAAWHARARTIGKVAGFGVLLESFWMPCPLRGDDRSQSPASQNPASQNPASQSPTYPCPSAFCLFPQTGA